MRVWTSREAGRHLVPVVTAVGAVLASASPALAGDGTFTPVLSGARRPRGLPCDADGEAPAG